MAKIIVCLIIGYLLGSMPWGYMVFRLRKRDDIRKFGSGNIGATNVGRLLGKKWAVTVAIADMFKGAAGLALAYFLGIRDPRWVALIGIAAVMGHNFPVWLSFKGGKGVSTTYGVVLFYAPAVSFAVAAMGGMIWLGVLKTTRYVSLASIFSLFSLPLWFFLFKADKAFILACLFLALLSTYRHRTNLKNILSGTERKTGRS